MTYIIRMYFRYDLEYIPRLLRKIKFVTDLKLREENVFQAGRIHDLKFLSRWRVKNDLLLTGTSTNDNAFLLPI